MRQRYLLLVGLIALGAVGGAAYLGAVRSAGPAGVEAPTAPVTVAVSRGEVEQTVTAPGQVVGTREAILGVRVAGRLAEIAVRPGQAVQAGQVLARLETEPLHDALETARFELAQAEAAHARQLAEAELNLEIAASRLAQARARLPTTDAAAAALAAAQTKLRQFRSGPDEDELTVAAAELRRAEIAWQQAQWAYDRVAYAADLGASPEAAQLEAATIEYESSWPPST